MTLKKQEAGSTIDREEAAERKLNEAVATAKRLKARSRQAKKRVKQAKKAAKDAAKSARKARKAADEARHEYRKMREKAAKERKSAAKARAPIVTPKRRSIERADDRDPHVAKLPGQFPQP